jgi:hypothetical protein
MDYKLTKNVDNKLLANVAQFKTQWFTQLGVNSKEIHKRNMILRTTF